MGEKVINAALLGLGTVGTGVYKVLKNQEEEMTAKIGCKVKIRKILVRNLEKAAGKVDDPAVLTNSWEDIKADPSIDIIIELIGGIEPARTYILDALHAGKHVVTANKDLIAVHGKELMDTARASHVDFLFEAAVAGGIPIIRPLKQCLAGNHMSEVMGIVNGTTNFILTKMSQENMEFKDALALATELGYAEADPTADIDGLDAGRKVAILASVAFNSRVVFDDVYIEGITKISAKDIRYAKEMGCAIKLLGVARNTESGVEAYVCPMLIPNDHPLATVNDSYNAVFVHGDAVEDAMFFGRGAGELPTASAVVGDIIDCVKHKGTNVCVIWDDEKLELAPTRDEVRSFFVRVKGNASDTAMVKEQFGDVEIITVDGLDNEFGFVTDKMTEEAFDKAAANVDMISRIRIDDTKLQ